jgi:multiple antibiotic resistance protein
MSGPSAIGVVMALAAHVEDASGYIGMVIGDAAVALSVTLFFSMGGPLVRRLGPSAVGASNKIFGFLILAIAVELV